jgi:hypothetical protein
LAEQQPGDPNEINILMPADLIAGVWANFARVNHSPYEFTIDFARLDFDGTQPVRGVVVQRVSVSPLFIRQLIDALEENWSNYADKAMPRDLRGDEDDD